MSNEGRGRSTAEEFRAKHSLGNKPIPNVARLIERTMGVGVAYVDVPAPGHGMTMEMDGKFLIAVGCTDHPMRLRSTLSHELGHLLLGTVNREASYTDWVERTPDEIQADAFARHLLVPLEAVKEAVTGKIVTQAVFSDVVQTFLASPAIAAIQFRDVGAIDQETYQQWSRISTVRLAYQFGWHSEYSMLVEQSRQPRAPQALLARAIQGYRWGLVAPAVIARLSGSSSYREVVTALEQQGIAPLDVHGIAADKPEDTGQRLTPEERAQFEGNLG